MPQRSHHDLNRAVLLWVSRGEPRVNRVQFRPGLKGEDVANEPGKGLEGFRLVCPIEVIGVGGVPDSCIQFAGLAFLGAHFAKGYQEVRLPVGKWAHERPQEGESSELDTRIWNASYP